ncbi:NAD(P)H-quinone oxidoreductase subunit 5 [Anthocerotibacter panamensis]|uniref:NAD(P)H-quinone oxidoreductase subunit 5 n=1 Tax=Anthocerotibacter panamensis TaxID=2857077 RepID=UPI001C404DEF|nr:NAD(P)H-quinone oxidoreductase subunit 5 [Anthocerotibacter panamensis]
MTPVFELAWLIPVYPLLAATVIGLGLVFFKEQMARQRLLAAAMSIGLIAVSFVHSLTVAFAVVAQKAEPYTWNFVWAQAGSFSLRMGFVVDNLAALMLVIVTSVALLVMVYSHGYMEHDPSYVRFFVYLSLFSSSMLGLVISPNLVQIYVFWELVGMCSYLLIGFWFYKKAAADACQKAFITNRVGDFGLLLGILGLFTITQSFEFGPIAESLKAQLSAGTIIGGAATVTLLCILVFLGPMAKSAQFPLHVWLPDAMEGPTPISALIHAATMVAAGVFLTARMFPVFLGSPETMAVISWIGGITAVLGATIALTQMDIKRGLAYSTVSQLGYMIVAMGLGAYGAGLFHLMTHAFFKAMLFLGSGSVIHAMEGAVPHRYAQDMRAMGGLRKYMPVTSATFFIGCVAISGIPPLSGFWSKDEILGAAFTAGTEGNVQALVLYVTLAATALLTAFYMFRIYFMTFEGEFRGNKAEVLSHIDEANAQEMPVLAFGPGAMHREELAHTTHGHDEGHEEGHYHDPHESTWTMTLPLVVLAVPSVFIGLIGTPFNNFFEAYIHPPGELVAHGAEHSFNLNEFLLVGGSSTLFSLIGISVAYYLYRVRTDLPGRIARQLQPLYQFSLHKWYIDDLYDLLFVRGSRTVAKVALTNDQKVVDGVVNASGFATLFAGEGLKYFESGRAQFYTLIIFASVVVLVWFLGLL